MKKENNEFLDCDFLLCNTIEVVDFIYDNLPNLFQEGVITSTYV